MKHALRIVMLCLVMAAVPPAAAQSPTAPTAYSSIASDLPLPPGLVEKPDTLVMFDAPEGRIAEVTMSATRSPVDTLAYYRATLPALGWYPENPQVWRRSEEMLTIRFADDGKSVIFYLEPLPPAVRSRIRSAPNW